MFEVEHFLEGVFFMLGAIEAGGTKFVCAVSPDGQKVEHREEFPTLSPEETMAMVYQYF